MSEQYFLQKCIGSAEDAKGSYSAMANMDLDPMTKQMYEGMKTDVTNHIHTLESRLQYLKTLNPPDNQN